MQFASEVDGIEHLKGVRELNRHGDMTCSSATLLFSMFAPYSPKSALNSSNFFAG